MRYPFAWQALGKRQAFVLEKQWHEIFGADFDTKTENKGRKAGTGRCLKGASAEEAYRSLPAGEVFVLYDGAEAYRCTGDHLPDLRSEVTGHAKIRVMPVDFSWTMVFYDPCPESGGGTYFAFRHWLDGR